MDDPIVPPSLERLYRAARAARDWRESLSATCSLAATLLADTVATLLLALDRLMDTWAVAHLLAGWVLALRGRPLPRISLGAAWIA